MDIGFQRGTKGRTILDRSRNKELEVEARGETIQQAQLKWFGHVMVIEDSRLATKAWRTKETCKKIENELKVESLSRSCNQNQREKMRAGKNSIHELKKMERFLKARNLKTKLCNKQSDIH